VCTGCHQSASWTGAASNGLKQPDAAARAATGLPAEAEPRGEQRLMPHGIIGGLPAVELFRDRWLCAVAADNPEVGAAITLSRLASLPWAAYQRVYDAPVTRQLSMLGIEPRVQVSVDSFHLLPAMVAGTRRVAVCLPTTGS
jgi:DNA-binding transcriptional LysR family regulator